MSVVMQILNVVRRCSEVPMMDEERLDLQQRLLNIPIAYLTDQNEQVSIYMLCLFVCLPVCLTHTLMHACVCVSVLSTVCVTS